MPSWSSALLNRHAAPEIASFISAEIPTLVLEFREAGFWVQNHFLNNVARGGFKEPWRQYAVNFIRRSQATFRFYHRARDVTLMYLDGNNPRNPKLGQYFEALETWEATLMNWAICLDIVHRMTGKPVFLKGTGSSEERAYGLYTAIKHHASAIKRGELAGDDILPFWLVTTGFRAKDCDLAFVEFADLVRDAARLSDELQDVQTFLEERWSSFNRRT